jgi:hypothetical protein
MKSIADQLPPEIARQLHPDRRKNEEEYWAVRDQLLEQYRDQWIGFADGTVIASGRHPFLICVGREEEPCRIRRVASSYDSRYPGEPMPLIEAEFRVTGGLLGIVLDRVIPDTGADASILPWPDCQLLQLAPAMGVQGLISGVTGGSVATLAFQIWVHIDGQDYPCRLLADFAGGERIIGRDVLNRLEILFRGPIGEVVVNP